MKAMKTRSVRHIFCLFLTAVFAILSNVGVAYAADAEPTDIGPAIMMDENGVIHTVDKNGKTAVVPTIGNAIRMEEDGTIVTTDGEGNETEFTPYLAPALCMDEFENLIYAENGYNVVSMLGPVFQTDEDGNIVETTADGMQTVVGKAPFVVGKMAEDGKITLVDADDTILYFELQDGQAKLVAAMTPAIYMDENGVVISVDYFVRETVISAPEGFVPAPDGYNQEVK